MDGIDDDEEEKTEDIGLDILAEKEQNFLDELALPGVPEQESQRRASWAKFPREARAAVRRLHNMTGHAPREVVLQILRGSNAAPEVIAAAKKFQCETCA